MARVNATVRDDHIEQLEALKDEVDAEGEISDAEATRRIFDQAARAGDLEQALSECRAAREQERADHRQEIAQVREELREEYESEIDYLEAQIDRLQRTNLMILEDRDRDTELEVYVDERREWEQANWLTRQKWKLLGKG